MKKQWNDKEIEFLKNNYLNLPTQELANKLQRTLSGVKNKLHVLGYVVNTTWPNDEIKFLSENYYRIPMVDLIKHLGKTKASIVGKAFLLGILNKNKIWSKEDDIWLKENFPNRTNGFCARILKTSESSITNRAFHFKIKKQKIKYDLTDEKKCPQCKRIKNILDFQYKKERDSYSFKCKDCLNFNSRNKIVRFLPEQEKEIKSLYAQGYGAPEIAKITKFSKKSKISRFIQQEKISRTNGEYNKLQADKLHKNKQFGFLIALERFVKNQQAYWKCKCSCGNTNIIIVSQHQLTSGGTKSCGCLVNRRGSLSPLWAGYEDISGSFFKRIEHGAKSRSLSFNLNIQEIWQLFIKQEKRCALTGLPIKFGQRSQSSDGTASLDRIDSKQGYFLQNVQWVHKIVNILKRELPEKEMLYIIKHIYEYKQLQNFNFETNLDNIKIMPINKR